MRILHALDSLELGGAQRVAIGIIDWLVARGHTVQVLAREGELADSLPDQAHLILAGSTLDYLAKLRSAISTFRPDVIHSHQRKEALLARVATLGSAGVGLVEHAHTRFPSPSNRIFSFRSDRIFAVSEDVANMLKVDFRVPADRVVLVENTPASMSALPPTPYRADSSSSCLKILGVGRLAEQKDPIRFVEVIASLSERVSVSATWVGDGPLRSAAENHAMQIGAPVEFVGYQRDVIPYIDAAELLLMTSRWEGLPLVALEAMARERLVVAPALPGLAELIGTKRGLTFEPAARAEEISALLLTSSRQEWPALAESGRLHIERRHSSERNNMTIFDHYNTLASR